MYRPEERLFAFRLRRNGQGEVLEGVSRRYTATALIGLAGEDQHIAAEVLGNHSREDVCGRLIDDFGKSQELGEVALTTWAARMLQHPRAIEAVETLRQMNPGREEEITDSLIDTKRNVIWRKVAQRGCDRLLRGLRAAASCLHSSIRAPGVGFLFPSISVDYESRPYHIGWILHAWPLNHEKKSVMQTSMLNRTHPLKA